MPTTLSSHILTTHSIFSIQNPERSPELNTLTEGVRVKIPDIFKNTISPQMGILLGQLPAFEKMISRDHRLFDLEIYHFLVSRGYDVPRYTENGKIDYKECVAEFIRKGMNLGAKIDADVFIETEIIAGAPRGSTTYKYYQTFDEKSWKQYIDKLPELYSMIAREFNGKGDERISAKFPGNIQLFQEKCDNLVIYCHRKQNLPRIQEIVESWKQRYAISSCNRPFYRSAFGVDAPPAPGENKTSFSDLCAQLATNYAKQFDEWQKQKTGKELSTREYNILALGQACMMANSDPGDISAKTIR